ncbi:MAG: NAD-binding protein [Calditrichia bacterium]|nr:NAD-binding protein [Calditrichia bacterium]
MEILKNILYFFRRNTLFAIFLLIFIISLTGAYIFYLVESGKNPELHSFSQAVWWVLVTITTVGYGDIVPNTEVGQFVGVFVIFTGIALVSLLTATISSVFVTQKLREEKGLEQITVKNHIIICGWNRTAEQIISVIFKNRENQPLVIVNQLAEEMVQNLIYKFKGKPLHYVRGDFAHEEILNLANIQHAKTVIIIPNSITGSNQISDEKTILTAFTVKAIQPKIKVYTHIMDKENAAYLKKAQVDDYIISDDFSGMLMGEMVTEPGVSQSLSAIMGKEQNEHITRLPVAEEHVGKTFGEILHFYRHKNIMPIAIVKENKPVSIMDVISRDDSFLDAFIEKKFKEAGRTLRKGPQLDVQLNPPDETILEKDTFLVVIK